MPRSYSHMHTRKFNPKYARTCSDRTYICIHVNLILSMRTHASAYTYAYTRTSNFNRLINPDTHMHTRKFNRKYARICPLHTYAHT